MKIWNYMSSDKEIQYRRAFIFRSAHNAFVNEIRANRKSLSLDTMMDEGFEPQSDINEMDVRESLETQKEVLEKIKHLPDEDKEVLILRYVEGLEIPEICEVLGVTENHASVKIHRAKQKLKKIYE
jgi:RNA polymerase sigma-70 factor (ECF subfamily)